MTGFSWVGRWPGPLVDAVGLLAQALYFRISQFVQDAAAAAVGDATIPPRFGRFRERRDALVAGLRAVGRLDFTAPAGDVPPGRCQLDRA